MNRAYDASRIAARFAALKNENRAAFIPFVMAGDPDLEHSFEILKQLPAAGADLIEIGMAFSDPMADGPSVQASAKRALDNGQTLASTLDMVRRFRIGDTTTPLILMGYFNPIFHYGVDAFVGDAKAAGVDGLIVVDCPPETDAELCLPAKAQGLDFIRLVATTSDAARLPSLLHHASGFLYLVSIAGVTGSASADPSLIAKRIEAVKALSDLPIVVGFGVKTPAQAATFAKQAEGVVIASVLLDLLTPKHQTTGAKVKTVADYLSFAQDLAKSIHGARCATTETITNKAR